MRSLLAYSTVSELSHVVVQRADNTTTTITIIYLVYLLSPMFGYSKKVRRCGDTSYFFFWHNIEPEIYICRASGAAGMLSVMVIGLVSYCMTCVTPTHIGLCAQAGLAAPSEVSLCQCEKALNGKWGETFPRFEMFLEATRRASGRNPSRRVSSPTRSSRFSRLNPSSGTLS